MSDARRRLHNRGLEVLPGQGRRFASVKQALLFYLLLAMAGALIFQFGYHWLGGQFMAWRLQIVAAEASSLAREQQVEGLIRRDEFVVQAPASGLVLQMSVPGSERVPAGAQVVVIGVIPAEEFDSLGSYASSSEDEEAEEDDRNGNEEPGGGADIQYWADQFSVFLDQGLPFLEVEEADPDRPALVVVRAEQPGFISFRLDGWESYGGSPYIDRVFFEETGFQEFQLKTGDAIAAGAPLFKIIDNWQWHYSFSAPLEPGRELAGRAYLDFYFSFAPDDKVRGIPVDSFVDEDAQVVEITCRFDRQIDGFDRARYTEARIEFDRLHGLAVPAEALFMLERQEGVYVNQGGRVVFKPVTVLAVRDEVALVEGLAEYSLVISQPDLVEEGQRLN